MEQQILSLSLADYKRQIDDLKASLLELEKGSAQYEKTVEELKEKQQSLNEAMAIGKREAEALEGSYNALQQQMAALRKEWEATNNEARRNELSAQISEIDGQLKDLDATIGQLQKSVGALQDEFGLDSLKSQLQSLREEINQLSSEGISTADEGMQQLAQTAGSLQDALGVDSIKTQLQELNEGMEQLSSDGINQAEESMQSLAQTANELQEAMGGELKTQLEGLGEGMEQLSSQDVSTADESMQQLAQTAGELSDALGGDNIQSQLEGLKDGMEQLSAQGVSSADEGMQQLAETVGTLSDSLGGDSLKTELQSLNEGMTQLASEGVSQTDESMQSLIKTSGTLQETMGVDNFQSQLTSLKDYKKQLDNLRASLLSMEKGSAEYEQTVQEIKSQQQSLNEVMAIGKRSTDALDGSYNALQQQMTALKQEWKATNDEARRNELSAQISEIDAQLKTLDASVGQFQRNVGNYAIAGESMKSQLKSLKEEIAQLSAQGVGPADDRMQQLVKTAAALEDAMGDASAMVKQAASDTSEFASLIDVAKTGTAVFGAFQGAMSAFGMEDQEAVKAIQQLNGVITTLNSLQQIQTALVDKASATYQLWNKALAAVGISTKVETAELTTMTTAQEANTVATGAATVATNTFSKALIATGIGAIVVALGALIANWDKLTGALKSVFGATEDYSQVNEELEKNIEKVNHQTDNEIKIMKAQGATESEIIAYKQKKIAEQIKEVRAKIADIKATEEQAKKAKWWKDVIIGVMKGVSVATKAWLTPLLYVFDKIFKTDYQKGFYSLIDKGVKEISNSIRNMGDISDEAKDEIKELEGNLEKLEQKQVDYNYDAEAARINAEKSKKTTKGQTDATKDLVKELNDEVAEIIRINNAEEKEIAHKNKLKKLKGELSDLDMLKEEENYLNRQVKVWEKIAEKYKAAMSERKKDTKEYIAFEEQYKKAMEKATGYRYQLEENAILQTNESRSRAMELAKERYNRYLDNMVMMTQSATTRMNQEFDAVQRGMRITVPPFPENLDKEVQKGYDEILSSVAESWRKVLASISAETETSLGESLNNSKLLESEDWIKDALSDIYAQIEKEEKTYWGELTAKQKDHTKEYIELEAIREQKAYELREEFREKEKNAVQKHYDDLWMALDKNDFAGQAKLKAEEELRLNEIQMEADADYAEHSIKMLDLIQARKRQDTIDHKNWVKNQVKSYTDLFNSIGGLMGGISSIMEENIKMKKDQGDISQEEAEKEFERVKAVQYSETWLNTLAGAAGAFLQGMENYPPPFGAIIGGTAAATALATGIAQTMAIRNTKFGGGGESSSSIGSGSGTGTPEIKDIQVAPLLNEMIDTQSLTAMNTEAMATNNGNQKVYILQSDIEKSQKQVTVRQQENTF